MTPGAPARRTPSSRAPRRRACGRVMPATTTRRTAGTRVARSAAAAPARTSVTRYARVPDSTAGPAGRAGGDGRAVARHPRPVSSVCPPPSKIPRRWHRPKGGDETDDFPSGPPPMRSTARTGALSAADRARTSAGGSGQALPLSAARTIGVQRVPISATSDLRQVQESATPMNLRIWRTPGGMSPRSGSWTISGLPT
jgi:hypothetical protein